MFAAVDNKIVKSSAQSLSSSLLLMSSIASSVSGLRMKSNALLAKPTAGPPGCSP